MGRLEFWVAIAIGIVDRVIVVAVALALALALAVAVRVQGSVAGISGGLSGRRGRGRRGRSRGWAKLFVVVVAETCCTGWVAWFWLVGCNHVCETRLQLVLRGLLIKG